MITPMDSNDVLEAMKLMDEAVKIDDYLAYPDRNEAYWVNGFLNILARAQGGDLDYLAIKDVEDGKMLGFMLCSTYIEQYCGRRVMDVKEMIVDHSAGKIKNAKTVKACFDYMIERVGELGRSDWRADTIRSGRLSEGYINYLLRTYNCTVQTGVRGVL